MCNFPLHGIPRMEPWDLLTTLLGRISPSIQPRTLRDLIPLPLSTYGVLSKRSFRPPRTTLHLTLPTRTRRCTTQQRQFSASGATCAPHPYAAHHHTLRSNPPDVHLTIPASMPLSLLLAQQASSYLRLST